MTNRFQDEYDRTVSQTKQIFEQLARPLSTPVLTKLPPGYSNWRTEADMEREIEQLRAALKGLASGNQLVVRYLREEHGITLDDD